MIVSYAKDISEAAKKAAKIAKKKGIKCNRMCDTCAFKWNQPHTLAYFIAADNAAKILANGGTFNCHTDGEFINGMIDKPCAGFELVKKIYQKFEL